MADSWKCIHFHSLIAVGVGREVKRSVGKQAFSNYASCQMKTLMSHLDDIIVVRDLLSFHWLYERGRVFMTL